MAQKPSIPRGTRDFAPEVMIRREYIFNTIKKVFKKYGYAPLETPSMEKLSVLTGKYGEEGDRLIFKILNNGDFLSKAKPENLNDSKKLSFDISERALRYDLTVPFARFVVMNQGKLTFPFKRYQIQPVWRADKPQKGRYREFYQCDADVVGSDSLIYEAEFISVFDEALTNLGLPGFSILVNNRKILSGYAEVVGHADKLTSICIAIDKLDKIGEEKVKGELVNRGIDETAADQLFQIIGFGGNNREKIAFLKEKLASSEIGMEGVSEMEGVLDYFENFQLGNGTVEFNLELARGLDYYTGTIFEVKAHNVQIGSICGGGRYADLTGVFGVKGLSGVGISFGADRIYDVMEALDLFQGIESSPLKVLLVNFEKDLVPTYLKILSSLRAAGISCELYPKSIKLGKQFAYADKKSIPFTLVVGADEAEKGLIKLKNMESGVEEILSLDQVILRMKFSYMENNNYDNIIISPMIPIIPRDYEIYSLKNKRDNSAISRIYLLKNTLSKAWLIVGENNLKYPISKKNGEATKRLVDNFINPISLIYQDISKSNFYISSYLIVNEDVEFDKDFANRIEFEHKIRLIRSGELANVLKIPNANLDKLFSQLSTK
ncbi:MAG: histidine--tRNA ligase [Bacteroidota bacterium]